VAGWICLALALGRCTPLPESVPQGKTEEGFSGRVQNREYLFAETGEQIRYSVYVSSKVAKDGKNPLIVALHGLGGGPTSMFRPESLRLAEEGGYVLVGPMGYNNTGWYGIPAASPARGSGAPATGSATAPRGSPVTDPALVRQYSEKDVLNVLELMRKEFNIDPRRTYLMGHSMGGAGALYLGTKYASQWAAVAAFAPASTGLPAASLAQAKDLPIIVVQGDADTSVPIANTRRLVEQFKAQNMNCVYREIPGANHGSVLAFGMEEVFRYFANHPREK
jgi:predicted esterase